MARDIMAEYYRLILIQFLEKEMEVKRKKQITIDVLSFKGREQAYVKFLSKIARSEHVGAEDDGRKSAFIARVVNLEDGVEYRLICPALLVSAMVQEGVDYVGKCFEIQVSREPKPGKDYKEVECWEIDEPLK